MSDKILYSNNGFSMRHVPSDYAVLPGEVTFDDVPTEEQLIEAFPQYSVTVKEVALKAQIKTLEGKITQRMRDEALLDVEDVISDDVHHEFYNLTAKEAITSVRDQISTLRDQL